MFHIIIHDPQQTFGTHQEILSSNKICFRQILKSVKIIHAPQITYRITRLKISGRGALVNGGFCIGEVCWGKRESLLCVTLPVPQEADLYGWHQGFPVLWLSWTTKSRTEGQWEGEEWGQSIYPNSRFPGVGCLSAGGYGFSQGQLYSRTCPLSSSTHSLPSSLTGLVLTVRLLH